MTAHLIKTLQSGFILIYWKEIISATSSARLANSLKTEEPDRLLDVFLWDIQFWLADKQPWKHPGNTKWKSAPFRACAGIFTEPRSSNTETISILALGEIFLSVKDLVINHTATSTFLCLFTTVILSSEGEYPLLFHLSGIYFKWIFFLGNNWVTLRNWRYFSV